MKKSEVLQKAPRLVEPIQEVVDHLTAVERAKNKETKSSDHRWDSIHMFYFHRSATGGPITQDVLLFLKLWVQIEEIGVKTRWPIIVRSLQLVNRIIN